MKHFNFFVAAFTTFGLLGCSQTTDLTLPTSSQTKIVLNPTKGDAEVTRAADAVIDRSFTFQVTALVGNENPVRLIDDATFAWDESGTYTTARDYFWPETEEVAFFAYAPSSDSQMSVKDYGTIEVAPSEDAASQVDLVYAYTKTSKAKSGTEGVALRFQHAMTRVSIQAKNTSGVLRAVVSEAKVVGLAKKGRLTFSNEGEGAVSLSMWSENEDAAVTKSYGVSASRKVFGPEAEAARLVSNSEDWMMVPQRTTGATGYTAATEGAAPNGSYIAVKMRLVDEASGLSVFGGSEGAWAMWPVTLEWLPGRHYRYVVDLSGGYREVCPGGGTALVPVLNDAAIRVAEVTLEEWDRDVDDDVDLDDDDDDDVDGDAVQLWENGPEWAMVNVGATMSGYEGVTSYTTATVGGLYPWGTTDKDGHADTWDASLMFGTEDIATAVSGAAWRMPTASEWRALLGVDEEGVSLASPLTSWTWCDGESRQYAEGCTLAGYEVCGVGAYAEKRIFLPASGQYALNMTAEGVNGYYWSGSQDAETGKVWRVKVSSEGGTMKEVSQLYPGCSVRAVKR